MTPCAKGSRHNGMEMKEIAGGARVTTDGREGIGQARGLSLTTVH